MRKSGYPPEWEDPLNDYNDNSWSDLWEEGKTSRTDSWNRS